MKETVQQAFLTDQKVTILMKNGEVFENKQIADYNEFGILTDDRFYILWGGIGKVIII